MIVGHNSVIIRTHVRSSIEFSSYSDGINVDSKKWSKAYLKCPKSDDLYGQCTNFIHLKVSMAFVYDFTNDY